MNLNRYQDLTVGLVFLTGSIAYYMMSLRIPDPNIAGDIGSSAIPKIIAALAGLLSLLLTLKGFWKLKEQAAAEAKQQDSAETSGWSFQYLPVLKTTGLLFAYIYAIEPVGFLPASALYLYLQFNVSAPAEKRTAKSQLYFAVGSLIAAVVINTVFVNVFDVMLPQGLLD